MTDELRPVDPFIQRRLKAIVTDALNEGTSDQRVLLVNHDYKVVEVLRYSAIKDKFHLAAKNALQGQDQLWAIIHIGLLRDRNIAYMSLIENQDHIYGMTYRLRPPRGTRWVKGFRLATTAWHRVWKEEDLATQD